MVSSGASAQKRRELKGEVVRRKKEGKIKTPESREREAKGKNHYFWHLDSISFNPEQ
jgi:hypothetical protein